MSGNHNKVPCKAGKTLDPSPFHGERRVVGEQNVRAC